MLFREHFLRGIRQGEVTLAFRRWRKPSVRSGGTLKTAIGVVQIGAVKQVTESAITAREAQAAGYESVQDLRAELDRRSGGSLYRIEVRYAGDDPRVALRNQDRLTALDLAEIKRRLERLDRASRHGPWTVAMLAACGVTLQGRAQGSSGLRREERSGAMLCHRDRRTTKPGARTPLRPTGYDGIGPSAARRRMGSIDVVVAPRIWPDGARNAALQSSATGCLG